MSDLLNTLKDEEGLDERERFFLDILFDRCGGDIPFAMKEAGYSDTVSPASIRRKLSKFIQARSKEFLVSSAAKASVSLVSVLHDPTAMGANTVLKAAKEVLDRANVKEEQTDSTIQVQNMFILPAKEEVAEEDGE